MLPGSVSLEGLRCYAEGSARVEIFTRLTSLIIDRCYAVPLFPRIHPGYRTGRLQVARLVVLFLMLFSTVTCLFAAPVRLLKSATGWRLEVSDRPVYIRGVGCNIDRGEHGEDYLQMAHDIGANAVRTWGIVPLQYFDHAREKGLFVDAGVWFDPVRNGKPDSYANARYRRQLTLEVMAYVKRMKHHPALLSWNLGNEVFSHTESETEREAFGKFLNKLIAAVHEEDPNHPVIYSCPDGTSELPYLKAHVPNLDIIGVNTYGGYRSALHWLEVNGYDKPVIATEFGCRGGWSQPKDPNNMPLDPSDQSKALDYAASWRQIEDSRGRSLGGFAFVLGPQRNQYSLTWFNLNFGRERRQSYWGLYSLYTGKKPANACPRIDTMQTEPAGPRAPGARVTVRTVAADPDGDRLRYRYFITNIATDPWVVEPPRFYPTRIFRSSPGEATLAVPNDPGVYRVYVTVSDDHDNLAVANRSIRVLRPAD